MKKTWLKKIWLFILYLWWFILGYNLVIWIYNNHKKIEHNKLVKKNNIYNCQSIIDTKKLSEYFKDKIDNIFIYDKCQIDKEDIIDYGKKSIYFKDFDTNNEKDIISLFKDITAIKIYEKWLWISQKEYNQIRKYVKIEKEKDEKIKKQKLDELISKNRLSDYLNIGNSLYINNKIWDLNYLVANNLFKTYIYDFKTKNLKENKWLLFIDWKEKWKIKELDNYLNSIKTKLESVLKIKK